MYQSKTDNYHLLTEAPVGRVILHLALPTMLSMLVTSIYNLTDTWFVGRISTQATAAIGVAFPVMSVIQAIGFFFGHGSGNYISRRLGARDTANAGAMATTGFVYAFVMGLVVACVGHLFLKPLCLALGSTPTILPYSLQYVGIILWGAPFMTASLVLNNQMRFQGNAAYAMVGVVSGAVLNVLLAPLFIFVLNMGVKGAAVATVVCQLFSFCLLVYMDGRGNNLRIHPRRFRLNVSLLKEIVRGGTPSLSRQGLACLSTMLLNLVAGRYGDAAIAGMSIVTRLSFLIFALLLGFGQGFQPVCGFNFGAGLYRRVISGFWLCVRLGTLFLSVCALLGFIWAPEIVHLFRHDPAVVEVGANALRWQLVVFPCIAFCTISNMTLQTVRYSVRATLLASSRQGLFFLPALFILPHFFGLSGLEACQAVADFLTFLLALPLMLSVIGKWKKIADRKTGAATAG